MPIHLVCDCVECTYSTVLKQDWCFGERNDWRLDSWDWDLGFDSQGLCPSAPAEGRATEDAGYPSGR